MPTAEEKNKPGMLEIKNEFLSIGVLPIGAELCSLKNRSTNTEHIWQANPEIWSSHAPNLFPVIAALKNGTYTYERKSYNMPRHGFIRHNDKIELKEKQDNRLVFNLAYSRDTLNIYPFKFNYEISFILKKRTLLVSHKVSNLDNKPMYFSLGGHPAFNICLKEGETIDDYSLEFDKNLDLNSHLLNKDGLISKRTVPITSNSNTIQLHKNLFDNDALIFKNINSKKVSLISKKAGKVLTVEYNDFKDLGIWAKPAAPYVCIEPWLGYADVEGTSQDIKTKEGIIKITPSQVFLASYSISIE